MSKGSVEEGMLIRGADGAIYHVPFNALDAYKVDEKIQAQVNETGIFDVTLVGQARSPRDVGLSASNEPTQTVTMDLSAFRK